MLETCGSNVEAYDGWLPFGHRKAPRYTILDVPTYGLLPPN